MRRCFSCGDDSNHLLTTLTLAIGVGDQQNHDTTSQAERLPPFFQAFVVSLDRQVAWVIEHQAGGLKTHSVLDGVSSILDPGPTQTSSPSVVTLL